MTTTPPSLFPDVEGILLRAIQIINQELKKDHLTEECRQSLVVLNQILADACREATHPVRRMALQIEAMGFERGGLVVLPPPLELGPRDIQTLEQAQGIIRRVADAAKDKEAQ